MWYYNELLSTCVPLPDNKVPWTVATLPGKNDRGMFENKGLESR